MMKEAGRTTLPRKVKEDGKGNLKPKPHDVNSPSSKVSPQGKAERTGATQPANTPGPSTRPKTVSAAAGPSTVGTPISYLSPDIPSILHDKEDDVTTAAGIARYFKEATKNFECMIQKAVESLVENIMLVETKLGSAIEFESQRVTEVEEKNRQLEKRMSKLEKEVQALRLETTKQTSAINKSERFSRRNNVRIVGIPEPTTGKEDCVALVENIAQVKFGLDIKVERAHRDGKSSQGRPRHILLKTLSYRQKIDLMRNQREKLADENYYMTDDLTYEDLIEKRKWNTSVQELYRNNVKLHFSGGKWRNQAGVPYIFKPTSNAK